MPTLEITIATIIYPTTSQPILGSWIESDREGRMPKPLTKILDPRYYMSDLGCFAYRITMCITHNGCGLQIKFRRKRIRVRMTTDISLPVHQ